MLKPRPYQAAAIDALYGYFSEKDGNPLVVMPTGTGKSVVPAVFTQRAAADHPGVRIVNLTHVRELISQNAKAQIRVWPGAPIGIYSASLGQRNHNAQILFAGIQSIYKKAYLLQRVDIVIIDEAHLLGDTEGGMYRTLLAQLKEINPYLKVIGLTATPYRMKSGMLHEGEGALFSDIAYEYSIADAVREGYLAAPVPKATDIVLDTSGVATVAGEFNAKQLEAAVDIAGVTDAAVAEMVAQGRDRVSWLAFCTGVSHAFNVCHAIRKHGISCETVTGETPMDERDRIIGDFKAGRLRAVTNANVLTTGFDHPGLDMMALLRPTKSKSLYVQMVGRGTRPVYADGFDMDSIEGRLAAMSAGPKPHGCLVLDFAGNTRRHGPLDMVDGRKKEPGGGESGDAAAPVKNCPECQAIIYAAMVACPHCGFEFPPPPPKIEPKSSTAPLLSFQANAVPPEWVAVDRVMYARYQQDTSKPPTLRVTYQCGLIRHHEWLCFDHPAGGYAHVKAQQWWRRRIALGAIPSSVADALARAHELPAPSHILLRQNGKFMEVANVRFPPEPGAVAA